MKKVYSVILTLIIGFIWYYLTLPAINIHSMDFWSFIILLIVIFFLIDKILNRQLKYVNVKGKDLFKNPSNYILLVIPVIILGIIITSIIYSPLFMASKYSNRIDVNKETDFSKDIAEVDFTKLPLLDKNSSQKLGDRVMGQMSDLVSQYYVSDLYTQINYNNNIIRVTPLEYASFIKWLSNKKEGVKGYITVDSVTGAAKLVRLNEGMKYLPSAYFSKDLTRKLRFSYPTEIFDKVSFEIDNNGTPYWVATTLNYKGVGSLASIKGVIVLNAVTGESIKYSKEEIPTWIDIAYSSDLIIEQVDDWGTYQDGFWNSIFSQKNVVNTTDGYNYLAMNDDIYLYTGLTSIVSDESNLGFILTNMRTGETNFYSVPGAEEYSAMASAEGAVQQMKYTSTFPLLINLNGSPTYLVSLKDAAGLVKMYGFIDVADYQKVVVTDSSKGIDEAANNYLKTAGIQNKGKDLIKETIIVDRITSAIINNETYYFIEANNQKYKVSINASDYLPFIKSGDKLNIKYLIKEDITLIKEIED